MLPKFKELESEITVAVGDPSKETQWTQDLLKAGEENGMKIKANYNNDQGEYDGGTYYNQYQHQTLEVYACMHIDN